MELEPLQWEEQHGLLRIDVTKRVPGLLEQLPRIEARNGECELQRRTGPDVGVFALPANTTTQRIERLLALTQGKERLRQARKGGRDLKRLWKLSKNALKQLDSLFVMARLGEMNTLDPHVLPTIRATRPSEPGLELRLVIVRP